MVARTWDPSTRGGGAEPREIIELSRPPEPTQFTQFQAGQSFTRTGGWGGRGGEAVNIYCRFRLRALEGSAINRYFKPRSSSADLGLEGDSQGTFRGLGHLGSGSSVDSVPTDAIVTNIGQMQESMPVTSTQLSGSPLTKHTCVDGTWKPLEF